MNPLPKVIVVCGPTASGKSALAVELALRLNGEVISADSRQVYRGLDIGTAKITVAEMKGVPHHLLDIADPTHRVSVAEYKAVGDTAIADILSRGKTPIICGGTGYYISALVDGINPAPVEPNEILREELEKKSAQELFEILKDKDPERAKTIDSKNKRRLVRALEIIEVLGTVPPLTQTQKYDVFWIGLEIKNSEHKKLITTRTLSRLEGMIEEATQLHKAGLPYERMRELGLEYGLLADLLEEKIDQSTFIERLNSKIWQYVRRQYTWFKRNKDIVWYSPKDKDSIFREVLGFMQFEAQPSIFPSRTE